MQSRIFLSENQTERLTFFEEYFFYKCLGQYFFKESFCQMPCRNIKIGIFSSLV